MYTNQSIDITLQSPCRTLDAVRAERVENLWIAATCSFRGSNTLSVVQFHADVNELSIAASFDMEESTRCVVGSPVDQSLLLTASEQGPAATLWKLPALQSSNDGSENDNHYDEHDQLQRSASSIKNRSFGLSTSDALQSVATLLPESGFGANIVDIAWRDPSEESSNGVGDVLTLDSNGHLTQWNLDSDVYQVHAVDTTDGTHPGTPPPRVAWDPHSNGHAVAVTIGRSVSILDWRIDTSIPTGMCARISASAVAHRGGISDIDYNPNKPYVLATAGYDGMARVWDLRNCKHPVMTARGGHSHWISKVRYNPCHDQLVLTAGTDCVANLWRLSTCSSAPLLQDTTTPTASGGGSETAAPNVRVARHAQHGDSIYAASWGAADSWVYLTLSYDGKATLNHVPSKEKYKILL